LDIQLAISTALLGSNEGVAVVVGGILLILALIVVTLGNARGRPDTAKGLSVTLIILGVGAILWAVGSTSLPSLLLAAALSTVAYAVLRLRMSPAVAKA